MPSSRVVAVAWITVAVVLVGLVALLLALVTRQTIRLDQAQQTDRDSQADREALHASVDRLDAALDRANRRLVAVGEKPVTTPAAEPVAGPPGEQGERGPRGVRASAASRVRLGRRATRRGRSRSCSPSTP